MLSALMLLAGVLIPILFLVPLFGRVEQGRLAAAQAARQAVRAAAESPSPTAAQQAAEQAVSDAEQGGSTQLALSLSGTLAPGETLQADVVGSVPLGRLPVLGDFGTIHVHGQARAPVDQYRSFLTEPAP
jgi:hypothetical protein